jgi:ATP-dependent helicase/nuclease subunit B
MQAVPLTIVCGPANCGKVALLVQRFLDAVDGGQNPFLVVPNRSDAELVERELLRRRGAVLGGSVGTFDDLFGLVLERCGEAPLVLSPAQRRLVLAEVIGAAELEALQAPARSPGFADGLARMFDELTVSDEPAAVGRRLAGLGGGQRFDEIRALRAAYLDRLAALGALDRAGTRARGAELVASRLDAWDGAPVLAHGFEDVTGVQLAALRALAGRGPVTVSLPYETGREAFAAVRPAMDALTAGPHELVELPPGDHADSPVLLHLERSLFALRDAGRAPEPDGSVVLLEACGMRGVADQVAAEALRLVREDGIPPEQICVIVTDTAPWRQVLESAFAAHELPAEVDATVELPTTAFGGALLALLRFAWFDGDRADLFRYLRSPFSGVLRRTVDHAEGRLRGRGMITGEHVRATLRELEYDRLLAAVDELEDDGDPLDQVERRVRRMSAAAAGLTARVLPEPERRHMAAVRTVERSVLELRELARRGLAPLDRAGLSDHLQRLAVRTGGDMAAGRLAVLDLRRVRTRRFQAAFVLGLEEGRLPRGGREDAFLRPDQAVELGLRRLDLGERDRHLFYTAVTRPWRRLFLSRQAADEEGRLREPSPFVDEVRTALGGPDALPRRRRALGDLTWDLESAPTERERLRALACDLRDRSEWALATAQQRDGWVRKLERARDAYPRRTRLTSPAVLASLAERTSFSVTELEKFADCSSAWFVERLLSPGEIDYEFGAKERGSVAHATLNRFHSRLPRELGVERVAEADLVAAAALMRSCLAEALRSVRLPDSPAGLEAVRALERDLEGYLRVESALDMPLAPRDFEVRFGTSGSAPGLKEGLKLDGFAVSGTIDRIDRDPAMSARGVIWDYKSGREVHSAADIENDWRLQIPLYILAVRELVGVEPVAGLYRALAGERSARGMAVSGEVETRYRNDQLDEAVFWGRVELAVERANQIVRRMRAGDVRHDPRQGTCPEWCRRRNAGICRVAS